MKKNRAYSMKCCVCKGPIMNTMIIVTSKIGPSGTYCSNKCMSIHLTLPNLDE